MTPREIAWRATGAARDAVDRWRFAAGRYPAPSDTSTHGCSPNPPCRLTDVPVGAWTGNAAPLLCEWRGGLIKRADGLMQHRLTFFNLDARHAGDPIDWNRDLENDRATPRTFAATIDYRNARLAGDAKVVWEPNRHQHLVVLARAYRATGDVRYAREAIAQIESWLDQSPFGYGMNWRSPLELGIRVINWVWTIDLIRESGAFGGAIEDRIRHAIQLHVWEIVRKYSRSSSANNHLIGEAAGVFVATGYFPEMPHHREWHEESRRILLNQLFAQTYADGGTREQAPGYLVFVIQFYLAAGILARKLGRDFPREHWARIEKTMEFLSGFLEGGPLPMLGDADDGYVLDLGGGGNDPATVLAAGATLFDREDFAAPGTSGREWAYWLLGTAEAAEPFSPARPVVVLACRAFPDTGYYMLQAGAALTDDAVSVVFDCAELGFGLLAAHGHADALAFVLRVAGVDVLVDPGTYDYFMYPEWRRYLRGTRAHNTLTIDSQDQSVMTGPFMWGSRAHARLREWKPSPSGGMVAGEHNGYTRLDDPVTHRRRIELDADARTIRITDEVVARGRHNVELNLHFSEHCRVSGGGGAFHVEIGGRALSVSVDARLMAMVVPAGDRPDSGWVSRGYHRRTAAPLVAGRTTTDGSATFLTQIRY